MPMTDTSGKEVVIVPCIHYPIWFQEGQKQVRALFDSGSKVNAMSSAYVERLGLKTQKTNVRAQKIDGSTLKTFGMVIADFQMKDKSGRLKFFQKTFLVANTKFIVVLGIFFLKISNANMTFGKRILTWKSYTTNKAILTTERVQLVNLKEFVIAALDTDNKTFVMHVAIREREEMTMDPERKAQIEAQIEA